MEAHIPLPPHTFPGLSTFRIFKSGSTRFLAHHFSRTHNENLLLADGRTPKLVLQKLENFKCCQKGRINRRLVKTFLGRCVQSHGCTIFTPLLYSWRLLHGRFFLTSSPLATWAHIWRSTKIRRLLQVRHLQSTDITADWLSALFHSSRSQKCHCNFSWLPSVTPQKWTDGMSCSSTIVTFHNFFVPSHTNYPSIWRYTIRHLKQRHSIKQ